MADIRDVERTHGRLPALDGLRGLAAVVVLLSHVVLAGVPAIRFADALGGDPPGAARWFASTPLAIVWAGPELVIVFFVLSGFVLTRALMARPTSAAAFLAGRVVRLYLPAWASLGLAAVLLALVARSPHYGALGGAGVWLDDFARHPGLESVSRSVALVLAPPPQSGGTLNVVLWSLRWEVLFSLALPLVVAASEPLRRLAVPVAVAALLAARLSGGHTALMYLPPFVIGVLLALREREVRALRARLDGRGTALAVGLAVCLLTGDRWLPGAMRVTGAGGMFVLLGASIAVALPLMYASVERALCTRPMAWLGSRSFSLYLVHFPVLLAFTYGLGVPSLGVLLALAVPASLLAAEAFHRVVERPCHALARAATAQVGARRPGKATRAAPPRAAPV